MLTSIGRPRVGFPVLALAAVLTLVALHFHCSLPVSEFHTHTGAASGSVHTEGSVFHLDGHAPGGDNCAHGHPCVPDSALPATGPFSPALILLMLLATALMVALTMPRAEGPAERGPPFAGLTAGTGRGLLTHLCIARR